jgi:hypothetical protein
LTDEQRLEQKGLYRALFRSGQKLSVALTAVRKQFSGEQAQVLIEFVASSQRGVCRDTGRDAETEANAEN